ncbi:hypothetical protein [Pseudoduganella sp. R-34]|uniref:hypothetical protein n=1 Tax=unclassified Pseudoduganella TaxID=2637179 RepID=UPI003CED9511
MQASALAAALAALLLTAPAVAQQGTYFHKKFDGTIGDKLKFSMDLKNVDGVISGTYRYAGKKSELFLKGKAAPDGTLVMDEQLAFNPTVTGRLRAVLRDGSLQGSWQSPDGGKNLPLVAHQTSEIIIPPKKALLAGAVGKYRLSAIQGFGGANTMWDLSRDSKGRWSGSESSISGGTRQGGDMGLSKSDEKLLASTLVEVLPDLSVRLSAGGKLLLTVPFREEGMEYGLREAFDDNLKALSPRTTVWDEQLYLLAQENTTFYRSLYTALVEDQPARVLLRYSVVSASFELTIKPAGCCDNAVLTFARSN